MTPTQASWVGNHCMHNFALTGTFFLCWPNTFPHPAKNRSCCVGAVLVQSHIVDLVTNEVFFTGYRKKITRLLYRAIWDIPGCQPNKLRPFRDAEKLFGILKNFSGCRKKILASRKDFDSGGFKLVVRSHIFEENMTKSLIGDVIQTGIYGENQVGLGLSRPFGGLACPIKLLPVWIALILAYFGVAGMMYCLIFLVAYLFEIPQRSWGITVDNVSPETA